MFFNFQFVPSKSHAAVSMKAVIDVSTQMDLRWYFDPILNLNYDWWMNGRTALPTGYAGVGLYHVVLARSLLCSSTYIHLHQPVDHTWNRVSGQDPHTQDTDCYTVRCHLSSFHQWCVCVCVAGYTSVCVQLTTTCNWLVAVRSTTSVNDRGKVLSV